jgi:hypothetical protein
MEHPADTPEDNKRWPDGPRHGGAGVADAIGKLGVPEEIEENVDE